VPDACGHAGIYAILDFARLPMAVMNGSAQIIWYVNHAFCHLAGKSREEMLGERCAALLPEGDECLLLLDRVYRTGNPESHSEQEHAKPHPLYWSYEIWPVLEELQDDGRPVGVILQVTESAPFHRRASVMNEALLVSAVRQHELMEGMELLNVKLQAEIQERQRAEAVIEQLAFYDPLTDLPNRRLLMDRLHLASLACCRTMHRGAILFIDLDQFKTLNDTQGHHLGDLLLQQVAHRLTTCVRACDTVARLGGDEFVVMIQELSEDPSGQMPKQRKSERRCLMRSTNPTCWLDMNTAAPEALASPCSVKTGSRWKIYSNERTWPNIGQKRRAAAPFNFSIPRCSTQ
jgi:GGDEF domain-containing protein